MGRGRGARRGCRERGMGTTRIGGDGAEVQRGATAGRGGRAVPTGGRRVPRVSRERRLRGATGRAGGGRTRRGRRTHRGKVMRTRGRGIERRPKRRVVEVVLHVEGHLARGRICRGVPRFSRGRAPRNSPLRRARHPPHKLDPTPKHVDARFLRGRRVRRRAARRVPAPPRVARPSSNARSAFASRVVRRLTKGIHSSRPSMFASPA